MRKNFWWRLQISIVVTRISCWTAESVLLTFVICLLTLYGDSTCTVSRQFFENLLSLTFVVCWLCKGIAHALYWDKAFVEVEEFYCYLPLWFVCWLCKGIAHALYRDKASFEARSAKLRLGKVSVIVWMWPQVEDLQIFPLPVVVSVHFANSWCLLHHAPMQLSETTSQC